MATALVVGGTAATGVSIVAGLRERGYDVTIYHRGTHELPELDDLEHIHGDPHHRATIAADLGTRRWDVVVATYGRIRSEEHTSELQSLMRISYAVFCLKKKNTIEHHHITTQSN